jgi:site-specific recombinase XerD
VVQELLGHSTMTTITLGSHAHTTTLHQQEATYFDRLLSGAQRS